MRKNILVIFLGLLFFLIGCKVKDNKNEPVEINIETLFLNSGVPGVSVAVIKDFQIDYLEVHGVKDTSTGEAVTEQTLFQAASISKPVAAMAALKFVLEKKITLNEDINLKLESWQVPENDYTLEKKVTLKRLLSHTAGTTVQAFPGYAYNETIPTLIQVLNGTPPANTPPVVVDRVPGSEFRYSGGGYCIVQQALIDIEAGACPQPKRESEITSSFPGNLRKITRFSPISSIEKKDFPQIMLETVFTPLFMQNSTYVQPLPAHLLNTAAAGHFSNGNPVTGKHHIYPEMAAAGLWTTPEDLALLLIELQLSIAGEPGKVLDSDFAEQMMTAVSANNYALGLEITIKAGQVYFGHGGANEGFRCLMKAHKYSGVGAVVMTNSEDGLNLAERIIDWIAAQESWPGY